MTTALKLWGKSEKQEGSDSRLGNLDSFNKFAEEFSCTLGRNVGESTPEK